MWALTRLRVPCSNEHYASLQNAFPPRAGVRFAAERPRWRSGTIGLSSLVTGWKLQAADTGKLPAKLSDAHRRAAAGEQRPEQSPFSMMSV